ncbi:MFS transporter [Luminiphilus syltensis]|nr:MFS transporter [Luminiphilus syltensis]
MTDTTPTKTIAESRESLILGLYMALAGYAVLAGIPVISTAWSNLLGFTEEQVGRVAGADLGGLAAGAVLAALFVAKANRRQIVLVAIAIAAVANVACAFYQDYMTTLILRFIAGVGSGLFTGVAVATLGARSNPAKAFNYLLFSFAFVQAGEMYVLPRLPMTTIYFVFAATYLITVPLLRWLPERPPETVLSEETDEGDSSVAVSPAIPKSVPWLFLIAMALTYVNIGAYWTYIELASARAGLDAEWVSSVLVWVSLFGLIGCLVATVISDRVGMGKPLLLTLLLHAFVVYLLVNDIDPPRFLISVYAFNFLWIFIDVYQMGSVASVCKTGRFATLMPAAQGIGQIIGPNIAASLLAAGHGYSSVFLLCALASLAAFVVYFIAYLLLRGLPSDVVAGAKSIGAKAIGMRA